MTANHPQAKNYSIHKAALLLKTGQPELFKMLRLAGLLYESKQLRNMPKEKYLRAGIFTTTFKMLLTGNTPRIFEQTLITESGLQYIQALLNGYTPALAPHNNNKAHGLQVLQQLRQSLTL